MAMATRSEHQQHDEQQPDRRIADRQSNGGWAPEQLGSLLVCLTTDGRQARLALPGSRIDLGIDDGKRLRHIFNRCGLALFPNRHGCLAQCVWKGLGKVDFMAIQAIGRRLT